MAGIHFSTVIAALAATTLAAASCKNVDEPPTPASVAGTWLYTESLVDNLYQVSCADTGTYIFTQDGGKVGGMFIQTGRCRANGSVLLNDGHGSITNGTVSDVRLQFTAADLCSYTGLLSTAHDAVPAGTGVCDFIDSASARHYSLQITWEMTRQ